MHNAILKKETRRLFIEKRKAAFSERASSEIAEKVLSLTEYKSASSVLCYASYNGEVDTFGLMERIFADGKKLYLPKCIVETRTIIPCEVGGFDELKKGAYGILEPVGKAAEPMSIDAVIVPMVAFDRKLTRLGYGGGYYDRFLPGTDAVKIGIAFATQEAEYLEREKTDIAMDMIITEKEVII